MAKKAKNGLFSRFSRFSAFFGPLGPARALAQEGFYINPSRRPPAVPAGPP